MVYFSCIVAFYLWYYMIVMRDHYIIDLYTGVIIAHWSVMQADWLTYYLDVKWFGLSHNKRTTYVTVPCIRCGWNNWKPR